MLIRKVILENFGLYGGRFEFDLVPRADCHRRRPIVLIGGKNGAGKTTLLEGVRLALYGLSSLGPRVRQADYEQYLRGRIHRARSELVPVMSASVALEFDHVRMGEQRTYRASRSWTAKGKTGVDEAFELLEVVNGGGATKPVEDLDGEGAAAFTREVVPEGLAQLFFFDGEKIRELAEDETGDEELARSIKSLLGLDLVERLSGDLKVYSSRKAGEFAEGEDRKKLASLKEKLRQLEVKRDDLEDQLAQKQTAIDGVDGDIQGAENRLRSEGQTFAGQRDHLKARRIVLKAQIQADEAEVRRQCEQLFPFAICHRTARRLLERIELAAGGDDPTVLTRLRDEVLAALEGSRPAEAKRTRVGRATYEAAITAVANFFESRQCRETEHEDEDALPTDLSSAQRQDVRAWLTRAFDESRPSVAQACERLEAANAELADVERQLSLIPAEDAIAPLLEELQRLNQRLGALASEQRVLLDTLDATKLEMAEIDRQRIRLESHINEREDVQRKLERVQRIQAALDEYLVRLTDRKIAALRQAVVGCYNRLARKGDVLKDIQIDARTFRVDLLDQAQTRIPKTELSSGEKQIYAIAMLWGLAQTSGRPLPVIIDTPLGRLDSEHRLNLCRNYFPHASHQVVLLSTDTEVDQALFDELSPFISHSFRLDFDPVHVRTGATENYFWREAVDV